MLRGDATATSTGSSASTILYGQNNRAFNDPGTNNVYLSKNAFTGLPATLLHEALHIAYPHPDGGIVGLGFSDEELAKAAGVYTDGMTQEQASTAFGEAIHDKCN